jgi:hypothetical protein
MSPAKTPRLAINVNHLFKESDFIANSSPVMVDQNFWDDGHHVRFGSVAASQQFITWAAGFGHKRPFT